MSSPANDPAALWGQLRESLAQHQLDEHAPRLEQAFELAAAAHQGQTRAEGLPYLIHPVRVCRILLEEWRVQDPDVLAAALLHDVVEDSAITLDGLQEQFGEPVRALVDLLTKPALAKGEEKSARDDAYWARLGESDNEASLIKGADRLDNVRSLLASGWPEAKQLGYLDEAEERVLPYMGRWPRAAISLAGEVGMIRARVEDGEGDLPDLGPQDQAQALAAGRDVAGDPVYRRSTHLSYFRREADLFLYHDLVGDIMQLHEQVLGFIDYFTEPRRESEARAAFATQFEVGDLDAFFEVLGEHLCLLREGSDDAEVVADWYPVYGPWVLSYQPKGGAAVVCYKDRRRDEVALETLSPLQGALFRLCDGKRALPEIVARLKEQFPKEPDLEERARRSVRAWTHSRRQLLKLLPRALETYDMVGLPPYAQSTMPYKLLREGEAIPAEEELSTREYHKQTISDAREQFEYRETTISHALRVPHPALGGRPYGSQLARCLVERDLLPDPQSGRAQLVEVGGGVGYFAKALVDGIALQAPRLFNRMRYSVVELSPALRASQREQTQLHADRVRVVGGDATALPFDDGSVDFLVSNEVIADLLVSPVRYEETFDAAAEGPGIEAVRRYGLDVRGAPGLFFVNTGALRFLEEIARVLKPGGTAVLTEYGSESDFPTQSTHLDHPEFSIHFGHLATAGSSLGLECGVEQLAGLLQLDGQVPVLQTTQSSFEALQALFARYEAPLEKVAYTQDMLSALAGGKLDLGRIEGLRFGPCGERLLGLKPKEFLAFTIRKPRREGRTTSAVVVDF
jgi:SAM-dependent methyltransferase